MKRDWLLVAGCICGAAVIAGVAFKLPQTVAFVSKSINKTVPASDVSDADAPGTVTEKSPCSAS